MYPGTVRLELIRSLIPSSLKFEENIFGVNLQSSLVECVIHLFNRSM